MLTNASAVDVRLSYDPVLFDNVKYTDITSYVSVPHVNVSGNNYYNVYAVGLAVGTPLLEALIALKQRK